MTATEAPAKPAKLPREEDPRNPVRRLTALLDEATLELITPDDDSGMLAAVGSVNGTRVVAFCSDATVMGGAMGVEGMLPFLVSAGILALALVPIPIAAAGGSVPSFHHHEAIPLRTRSFASWQARSARPTIEKAGRASSRHASTSTRRGSSPTSACVTVRASTPLDASRARPTCL